MKKIFLIKFASISLIVLSIIIFIAFMWDIYKIDPSFSSVSENLIVFGGVFFSCFSVIFLNNELLSNINDIKQNNFKERKKLSDPIIRICFLLTLVICIGQFIFGIFKTFFGPLQKRDPTAIIPLIVLLIFILLNIFIFISSFKIRKKIEYEKFIEKEISKIGN